MKMSKKGIPSHMVRCIQMWLINRLTWVTFDEVRCRTVSLKQGVQQGSGLSPLLFLFCIDDLVSVVGAPQISFFTDNVAVWTQDTDLERATSKLQKGLEAIASCSTSWKMELKLQKSVFLLYHKHIRSKTASSSIPQ